MPRELLGAIAAYAMMAAATGFLLWVLVVTL